MNSSIIVKQAKDLILNWKQSNKNKGVAARLLEELLQRNAYLLEAKLVIEELSRETQGLDLPSDLTQRAKFLLDNIESL